MELPASVRIGVCRGKFTALETRTGGKRLLSTIVDREKAKVAPQVPYSVQVRSVSTRKEGLERADKAPGM